MANLQTHKTAFTLTISEDYFGIVTDVTLVCNGIKDPNRTMRATWQEIHKFSATTYVPENNLQVRKAIVGIESALADKRVIRRDSLQGYADYHLTWDDLSTPAMQALLDLTPRTVGKDRKFNIKDYGCLPS